MLNGWGVAGLHVVVEVVVLVLDVEVVLVDVDVEVDVEVVLVVLVELEVVVVVIGFGHTPSIQFAPIVIVTSSSLANPQHPQYCNVWCDRIVIGLLVLPLQSL